MQAEYTLHIYTVLLGFIIKMTKKIRSHVYVFGSGDCGQLGLGEEVDMCRKPRLHDYFEDKQIHQLVAGGLHSLALGLDGRVYSWGCNDEKALGHGGPEFAVSEVEELRGLGVVEVAAGDSISAALTSDGKVYSWGTFRVDYTKMACPLIIFH